MTVRDCSVLYKGSVMLSLSRRLGSLPQPRLRLSWLSRWLSETDGEAAAPVIEALYDEVESFVGQAIPGVVTFVAWASGAVDPPRLHELATAALRSNQFRLRRVLARAHECPLDLEQDREPALRQLPHSVQRSLTLGERKTLARRPGRGEISRLLRDPHPAVIEQLLCNPQLTEADLLRLVTLRPAHPRSLCHLFRDVRWITSPRVRMGLLLNPGLPLWQSIPLLSLCPRPELVRLSRATHVAGELQDAARTHLQRHLPLHDDAKSHTIH